MGGGVLFLGTCTPKLDERAADAARQVSRRAGRRSDGRQSRDRSLAVYPRAEFEQRARTAVEAAKTNPERRAELRVFAAGADEQHPDGQGPDHPFVRPSSLRGSLQRSAWSSVLSTTRKSGTRRPGTTTKRHTRTSRGGDEALSDNN